MKFITALLFGAASATWLQSDVEPELTTVQLQTVSSQDQCEEG